MKKYLFALLVTFFYISSANAKHENMNHGSKSMKSGQTSDNPNPTMNHEGKEMERT